LSIIKSRSKKILSLLGVSIILFVAFALLSNALTQNVEPHSASVFFQFKNISNKTLDPMVHLRIVDLKNSKNMDFTDATISPVSQNTTEKPFYVTKTVDGSGLTLFVKNLTEENSVAFQADNIIIYSETLSDFHALRMYVDPVEPLGSTQMEYELVLSIFGSNIFGRYSLASLHSFTQEIREGVVTSPYYSYRTQGLEYTVFLCVSLYFVSLGILFLFVYPEPTKNRFPFVTFTLLAITTYLYAFVGSGREWANLHPLVDYRDLTSPLSVFFHGYNQHITGNLFYFIPLSLLMESWLRIRKNVGTLIVWYFLPLLLPQTLVYCGIRGFGLSLSIESMTWVLWLRIMKEWMKKRIDILLTILSGIPSFVFFGWLYEILFSRSPIPYYQNLEFIHVGYGAITLVGLIVICTRRRLIEYAESICDRRFKKRESGQNSRDQ